MIKGQTAGIMQQQNCPVLVSSQANRLSGPSRIELFSQRILVFKAFYALW